MSANKKHISQIRLSTYETIDSVVSIDCDKETAIELTQFFLNKKIEMDNIKEPEHEIQHKV